MTDTNEQARARQIVQEWAEVADHRSLTVKDGRLIDAIAKALHDARIQSPSRTEYIQAVERLRANIENEPENNGYESALNDAITTLKSLEGKGE